jgi:hypothetical protein
VTDELTECDPFELPEWLGVEEVTWSSESGVRNGHHVTGVLSAGDLHTLACDLIGVDEAYPAPVVHDDVRARAHQAWRHGQVLLVERGDRLTLAVPGTGFTADLVLDALSRLARALGASPERFTARLRIGVDQGRGSR